MTSTFNPDQLANLRRNLFAPSIDLLRGVDVDNIELGSFLRLYAGPPSIADLEARSTIREDSVVRELTRLLGEFADDLHIVDACCGEASLATRILSSIDEKSKSRIIYSAVDQDAGCMRSIRARLDDFMHFKSFRHIQRQIGDIDDIGSGQVDCIIVNNALHEIAPHSYPEIFETLNILLKPDRGRICIVDMESLPAEAPEAIAINWHGGEITTILEAGGLSVELSRHQKAITVYQAHVRHAPGGVNKSAMKAAIKLAIRQKLTTQIKNRRRIESALREDLGGHKAWLVATGSIARLADELLALDEMTNI